MTKWVEIAVKPAQVQRQTLSDFLNRHGVPNSVDLVEASTVDFLEQLEEAKKKYSLIRLGSPFKTMITEEQKNHAATMRILNAADCMFKMDRGWRLQAATYEGLLKVLEIEGKALDLSSTVLLVGAGAGARFSVAALVKVGFKHFNIANKFDEQALEMIRDLERYYFDVEFKFIPQERLVLLPGMNGVVINTTPLTPTNDLLGELYYFNFLKSNGLAIDFTVIPPNTPFVQEAHGIGIRTVPGWRLAAFSDVVWAKWAFGVDLDREAYLKEFKSAIDAVDFDLTPYIEAET